MTGSAAAAFVAGMIAFFAPCCSGVMMPTYLAAISGHKPLRTAMLTAIYVAGVAAIVWPITMGAGAIGQLASRFHPELFVIGGLMMLATAIALWRGTMLSLPFARQPEMTGSVGSVFLLGVFSGAITACCAPVLAGAVALSALNGSALGGFILGGAYILGIVFPLVIIALFFTGAKARGKAGDWKFTIRLGSYVKSTSISRLVGTAVFGGFGLFFVVAAVTGQSRRALGFQRSMSTYLNNHVAPYATHVSNLIAWPVLALFVAGLIAVVIRSLRKKETTHE
jgi:cytochrome c biogenesis protein CcdA